MLQEGQARTARSRKEQNWKGGFACEQVAPKRDWYEQEFLIKTALDRIVQGQEWIPCSRKGQKWKGCSRKGHEWTGCSRKGQE
jgi:hypothetical protein